MPAAVSYSYTYEISLHNSSSLHREHIQCLIIIFPVSKASNPPLDATHRLLDAASTVHVVLQVRIVCARELMVLAVVTSDGNRVTRVECAITLSTVVVAVQVCVVFHLDAIVIDFVGFEGAVERELRLGFAFEVFWVVVLRLSVFRSIRFAESHEV